MPIIISKNAQCAFYIDVHKLSQLTRHQNFDLGDWSNDIILFEDGTMSRFEPANSIGLWPTPIEASIKTILNEISKVDEQILTHQQAPIKTWEELFERIIVSPSPFDLEQPANSMIFIFSLSLIVIIIIGLIVSVLGKWKI